MIYFLKQALIICCTKLLGNCFVAIKSSSFLLYKNHFFLHVYKIAKYVISLDCPIKNATKFIIPANNLKGLSMQIKKQSTRDLLSSKVILYIPSIYIFHLGELSRLSPRATKESCISTDYSTLPNNAELVGYNLVPCY